MLVSALRDFSSPHADTRAELHANTNTLLDCAAKFSSSGPDLWKDDYPTASGIKQSPIDIVTAEAVLDPLLLERAWKFQYEPRQAQVVTNTGSSVTVSYGDGSSECPVVAIIGSAGTVLINNLHLPHFPLRSFCCLEVKLFLVELDFDPNTL